MSSGCPYCGVFSKDHMPYCPTQFVGEQRDQFIQVLKNKEMEQFEKELEEWVKTGETDITLRSC